MKKYVYRNQSAAPYDTIEAIFKFTDIDGNQVEGGHSRSNVLELLESLGDVMTEEFHPTVNKAALWMNGIIDISKPITITILPRGASK